MSKSAFPKRAWTAVAVLSFVTGASLAFAAWYTGRPIIPWYRTTHKELEPGNEAINVSITLAVGLALLICGGNLFHRRARATRAWPPIVIVAGAVAGAVVALLASILLGPGVLIVIAVDRYVVDARAEERVARARALPIPEAVTELRRLVRERNYSTRSKALESLAKLGPDAAPAVPELVGVLEREYDPGGWALETLIKLGPAAGSAERRIAELARTGEPPWRRTSAERVLDAIRASSTPVRDVGPDPESKSESPANPHAQFQGGQE